ncbi:MAG TPA: hypothetical protein VGE01_04430 [Fimbriimonas sp.]
MTGLPVYLSIALLWLGAAVFWAAMANRLGRQYAAPNDGCLLGCGNVVLSFVGGGLGFLVAPYPWSIGTSFGGALLLPGLATWYFAARNRR